MELGQVFAGRYRVVRELGRGGMGIVYRAVDLSLGRDVALKAISLTARDDPAAAGRFQREARALAALQHPGVVTVHDYGESDGVLYLVMRLVEGTDLAQRLSGHRRLSPARTAELAEQVASALDAVHARDLVHRDIKPSNILLEGDAQRPVLCDFGLAKPTDGSDGLTTTGRAPGTVPYMAPEQFRGEPATRACDVYAFGCVLFHCLTGRPPYTGTDQYEVAAAHLAHPVPDALAVHPGLPAGVQDVLARCLAKDPAARWPTAGSAAAALRTALGGDGRTIVLDRTVDLPPPPVPGPAPVLPDPQPTRVPRSLVAGCAAVVLAAGVGGAALGLRPAQPQPISGGTTDAATSPLFVADHDEADAALGALLADGYGECSPLERRPGQLSKLNCDRTPEGLATVHVVQWQDSQQMGAAFRRLFLDKPEYDQKPCSEFAGGSAARGTGHVSSRPGVGGIACYVNVNDDAVLLWQYDDRAVQVVAIRDDADSAALFGWWEDHRDTVLPTGPGQPAD